MKSYTDSPLHRYDGMWSDITNPLYWKLYDMGKDLENHTVFDVAEMLNVSASVLLSCYLFYYDYLRYTFRKSMPRLVETRRNVVRSALAVRPLTATELARTISLKPCLLHGVLDGMDDLAYDDDSRLYFLANLYEEQKHLLLSAALKVKSARRRKKS